MKIWLAQHRDAAWLALRRLGAAPVNSLLALLAIGVALSLPAGGQMLLASSQHLLGATATGPQISVFLTTDADRRTASDIEDRLRRYGGVRRVELLPREATLARFKSGPGLKEVIEALPGNPFPDALVVTSADDRPDALEKLATEFRRWPKVDHVQLDSAWVRRLDALIRLGRTAVGLLGGLLGLGLIAITFNTIRLQVLTQRLEIEVSQLLGATNAYIRRPFLYYGSLLGLGGGVVAWLLAALGALLLREPLAAMAQLYELTLTLQPLGVRDSALLLSGAAALGWLGAALSLRAHLRPE